MAKKRKAAARRRTKRKPAARRRRAHNPDTTINALVILVVIVVVLGGLYLYVQNKKQAALLPVFGHAVATLVAPAPQMPLPQSAAFVMAPAAPFALTPVSGSAADVPQPIPALEAK